MIATPIHVCIVDDDEAVRDSLRILLVAHGVEVQAFASPMDFLDHVMTQGKKTVGDCLIFDLHMPDMTGLELAESLRARKVTAPVIIMTGRIDRLLAARMERAGVIAVLAKPVAVDELVSAMEKAISIGCASAGCS